MPRLTRDVVLVLLSVLVQLPLAVFLGHYYDERSFLDTGYLVGSGLNPYKSYLITVFSSNPYMVGTNPIIGYPPLWPLLLGLIYKLSFNVVPNLFLYNFAVKIPVVITNIALAFAVRGIMQKVGSPPKVVWFAWLFLLFNPFTLLTTTAWGDFDTLIALLVVVGLYFLSTGKVWESSLLFALSIVLKPIALPLLGLPLLFRASNTSKNIKKNIIYVLVVVAVVAAVWFLPFKFFGWDEPTSPSQLMSFFQMAGGMTIFNAAELATHTATLPLDLGFLGYLWVPALLLGYFYVYLHPPKNMRRLVEYAVGLLLIFFLTRTWLSEPNVNLLLALMLILVGFGAVKLRSFNLVWVVALIFMFLNLALPQLFFLVYPQVMPTIAVFNAQYGTARVVARLALTVFWYALASSIIVQVMKPKTR
jgi:hypothetical protein